MLNFVPDDDPDDAAFEALCERIRFACIGFDDATMVLALQCELAEAIGRIPSRERGYELQMAILSLEQYVSEIPPC